MTKYPNVEDLIKMGIFIIKKENAKYIHPCTNVPTLFCWAIIF